MMRVSHDYHFWTVLMLKMVKYFRCWRRTVYQSKISSGFTQSLLNNLQFVLLKPTWTRSYIIWALSAYLSKTSWSNVMQSPAIDSFDKWCLFLASNIWLKKKIVLKNLECQFEVFYVNLPPTDAEKNLSCFWGLECHTSHKFLVQILFSKGGSFVTTMTLLLLAWQSNQKSDTKILFFDEKWRCRHHFSKKHRT